jgi:hypothetical protein
MLIADMPMALPALPSGNPVAETPTNHGAGTGMRILITRDVSVHQG